MKNWFKTGLMVIGLLAGMPSVVMASIDLESIEQMPPGEKYRRLSLLLLISGGVEPGLQELLQTLEEYDSGDAASRSDDFALQFEDFQTPLARIVDRETMLAGAAQIFRYARENSPQIQVQLTEITAANPILVSMVDVNEIAEDAIIIRTAIADAIEYSELMNRPQAKQQLETFRNQTIYLRNIMEYNIFQAELAQITNRAIIDLGGRLDAYQRMFEDDVDPELIQRRIESAQIMNAQTSTIFDDQAKMRTNELLMMLILMESQVH